jgi:hypothetical protein
VLGAIFRVFSSVLKYCAQSNSNNSQHSNCKSINFFCHMAYSWAKRKKIGLMKIWFFACGIHSHQMLGNRCLWPFFVGSNLSSFLNFLKSFFFIKQKLRIFEINWWFWTNIVSFCNFLRHWHLKPTKFVKVSPFSQVGRVNTFHILQTRRKGPSPFWVEICMGGTFRTQNL